MTSRFLRFEVISGQTLDFCISLRAQNIMDKIIHGPWRALMLCCVLVLCGAGCCHVKPYVKPGLAGFEAAPASGQIKKRFLLIGETGYLPLHDPLIDIIQQKAAQIPEATTLLFLGNNVPSCGFPTQNDPARPRVEHLLEAKTRISVTTAAKSIFLPGNNDWSDARRIGLGGLLREQNFINAQTNCALLPFRGLAPPVENDFDHGMLAILNTEWWLVTDRLTYDPELVKSKLKALAGKVGDYQLLLAAHHPLRSYGIRQGYFSWRQWFFPLSMEWKACYLPLPAIYPMLRIMRFSPQDLFSPSNCDMRQAFLASLSQGKPWIFASGHEIGLQVIHRDQQYYLVSGGGSPSQLPFGAVWHGADTEFAQLTSGFMVLDFVQDKAPFLTVIDGSTGKVLFSKALRP